jgi:hypothetical protein
MASIRHKNEGILRPVFAPKAMKRRKRGETTCFMAVLLQQCVLYSVGGRFFSFFNGSAIAIRKAIPGKRISS